MNIIRVPILSCSRDDSEFPWYAVSVDDAGKLAIDAASHTGKASPLAKSSHDISTPLTMQRATAVAVEAAPSPPIVERMAVAVTLDNRLEVVPLSQQQPTYQAHLGFYDPATDTLELLEFKEMHTDEEHAAMSADASAAQEATP